MSGARPTAPRSPRQWSWYRLADRFAAELVHRAAPPPGSLVLDLGAGEGAITRHLARHRSRVIAFELHPDRAATLRRGFEHDDVKVVVADVRDLRLPRRPFRVVANPPFDGVSAVLVRLTHRASRLERADLLIPRSTAQSWSRRLDRRHTGFALRIEGTVPRSAFTPRPRIDVVHASIIRRRPQ